jgi:hypothetical protein
MRREVGDERRRDEVGAANSARLFMEAEPFILIREMLSVPGNTLLFKKVL